MKNFILAALLLCISADAAFAAVDNPRAALNYDPRVVALYANDCPRCRGQYGGAWDTWQKVKPVYRVYKKGRAVYNRVVK